MPEPVKPEQEVRAEEEEGAEEEEREEEVRTEEEEEESADSEEERSLCRSPAKSPRKRSSILKRKRRPSEEEEVTEEEEEEVEKTAETAREPTDEDFQFKEPKLRKKKFIFQGFRRSSEGRGGPEPGGAVEVVIPEQLAASYGLYIWPSSPVLAWYLWLHQSSLTPGSRVLELGAGTALPGLLLARLGHRVTLSDSLLLPQTLANCRAAIACNNLQEQVQVIGLTWGLVTSQLLALRGKVDLVIGSDLFFDPSVFEPLLVTVKWLLSNNQGCEFLVTVQERSADWSMEVLLSKYRLKASTLHPREFLAGSGIQESDLTGDHSITLLRITNED